MIFRVFTRVITILARRRRTVVGTLLLLVLPRCTEHLRVASSHTVCVDSMGSDFFPTIFNKLAKNTALML